MLAHYFKRSQYGSCVYIKFVNRSPIYLILYVYDILITAKSKKEITSLKAHLSSEFQMKDLGVAKNILGMEIIRDGNSGLIFISQHNYINKVLHCFNMPDVKKVTTLIAPHFKLSSTQCPIYEEEVYVSSSIL
jgi:hypothetical protein